MTTPRKKGEEEHKVKIYAWISSGSEDPVYLGELDIELDFIPQYTQDLVSMIDNELLNDNWMKNNFGKNDLLTDIVNVLGDAVEPLWIDPLVEKDDNTSVVKILNDAMLDAWAHGEEGNADTETRDKRKAWNDLLKGDTFINSARDNILEELFNLWDPEKYKVIAAILGTMFKPSGESIAQYIPGETEEYSWLNGLIQAFFSAIRKQPFQSYTVFPKFQRRFKSLHSNRHAANSSRNARSTASGIYQRHKHTGGFHLGFSYSTVFTPMKRGNL